MLKRVQKGNAFLLFTHKTSFILSMSQEKALMMCLKSSAEIVFYNFWFSEL